jgi:hypothetical protein
MRRYDHDCERCIFLGQYKEYDLYFCPSRDYSTVIARWDSIPSNYASGLHCANLNVNNPLYFAKLIAIQIGLLNEET